MSILEKILKCEVSGKAYRLIPMELAFYRRIGLPIPRKSPLQRHKERLQQLLPWRLYERRCMCNNLRKHESSGVHAHGEGACPNTIVTPYEEGRPELVYCEQCYQSEVN